MLTVLIMLKIRNDNDKNQRNNQFKIRKYKFYKVLYRKYLTLL